MAMYLLPAAYIELLDYEHFSLEIVWILPLLALTLVGSRAHGGGRCPGPGAGRSWHGHSSSPCRGRSCSCARPTSDCGSCRWAWRTRAWAFSPWQANLNVTYFVLGHNVGLLWIDALFRWFSGEPRALFTSRIVKPLAAAAAIACLVGGYQALVDLNFLSGHLWPYFRRAAGTLADANAFGVIAALWVPGFVVLARAFPQPWATVVGIGGVDARHDGRVDVRIAHRA